MEKKRCPDAPMRVLRFFTKRFAKGKWDLVEELVNEWEGTEPPDGNALEEYLTEYIQREGLFYIAQDIFSRYDTRGKVLDPRKYRDTLNRLCFSLERENESIPRYSAAKDNYYDHIQDGRMPFGITAIDNALGSGLGKRELGIILAPLGGGKSAILSILSARTGLKGKRVLHVTLEISKWAVMERIDMCLGSFTTPELEQDPRKIRKCRRLMRKSGGDIIIQDFSHEAFGLSHMETLIERYKPLDLVVLDYADLMIGTGTDLRRFELGHIYRGLRRMTAAFDIPLWTASQSNRQSMGAEVWGVENIAEDISKAQTCDALICLLQTPEEKLRKRMRLKVDKTRRTSLNPIVPVVMDYDRMQLEEVTEPITEVEDGSPETDQGRGKSDRWTHP